MKRIELKELIARRDALDRAGVERLSPEELVTFLNICNEIAWRENQDRRAVVNK